MTFTFGCEAIVHSPPVYYTEVEMTATKTRTKPEKPASVRYRTDCPRCGYALAMADTGRDEIHCASCHRTSAIPTSVPEPRAVDVVSELIEAMVVATNGPGSVAWRVSPTAFAIECLGGNYTVTVDPA